MHHSRMFIDLAENIHIHHREFRTVFSLNEFFEYTSIIEKSTQDVRNFLEQNLNYEEQKYPTTILIAGGKERQLKYLDNSTKPNESKYFANDLSIELQDEFVTDEIHIHYRDFRIAMNRENFKIFAKALNKACNSLENFENKNNYKRQSHSDRIINKFNISDKSTIFEPAGIIKVPLSKISSPYFNDIEKEMKKNKINPKFTRHLEKEYNKIKTFAPIILSKEVNGKHLIVDGHHRCLVAIKMQLKEIDAVVINLTQAQTENLRKADAFLKKFDLETNYKYASSSFLAAYLGYKLNIFHSGSFNQKMFKRNSLFLFLKSIKNFFLGK